jgi:threonine 3-dehydrogenase
VTYDPCPRRSAIAASWPMLLNDENAKKDWGWNYETNVYQLAKKILVNIDD